MLAIAAVTLLLLAVGHGPRSDIAIQLRNPPFIVGMTCYQIQIIVRKFNEARYIGSALLADDAMICIPANLQVQIFGIASIDRAAQYPVAYTRIGGSVMRICIYKTDRAPDLTLLLREGLPLPPTIDVKSWTKFKTLTEGEIGEDLLNQIDGAGYSLVRLKLALRH